MTRESWPLVVAKAVVAAAGVCLFLYPLATTAGLIAGGVGTLAGYILARVAHARGLRVPAGLAIAGLGLAIARLAGRGLLDHPVRELSEALPVADAVFYGVGAASALFAMRMLSQRWRPFALLELAIVVGAVARTFAAHRHHHIHEPRFLTDWAWSHGIDPTLILQGLGVAAIVVAAIMLLDLRRASKLVVSLLFLIAAALIAYLILRDVRIDVEPDTNGIGLGKDGQGSGSGSGSGSGGGGGAGGAPDPVAVVVLRDELPDVDVLYLRQAVLSRFAVDRLVEDGTGQYDRDVIRAFPSHAPIRVDSPQAPGLHDLLHTSVYLLVDHGQPFGVGHPVEVRQLDNPSPRQFVAAYDVDSYLLHEDLRRLSGRNAGDAHWSAEEREHYLAMPADPRYRKLSDQIVRDMDPRFVGDDLMKALALKRYLETHGFYSLAQKTLVGTDPTAKFLFGDMRGYCVHFAHAMVFLLRSQGIPARVSLGYAVQPRAHGAGSSLLVFGHDAHAWPELYLDGVGWVTFDVYPEKSDEPPPTPVDGDLESMLGELARKDKTGGKAADPNTRLEIPWLEISLSFGGLAGALLVASYGLKIIRRTRRSSHRVIYRGILDRLGDVGLRRELGETRERHAERVATLAPSFVPLTRAHLRAALGGPLDPTALPFGSAAGRSKAAAGDGLPAFVGLARRARRELAANVSWPRRIAAWLNPIGWMFTR